LSNQFSPGVIDLRSKSQGFWNALQRFVDAAHMEACGGPFEITAAMPDGDFASLIHSLIDVVDYNDLVGQESDFLMRRVGTRRYGEA
jgi:hypothetical protein